MATCKDCVHYELCSGRDMQLINHNSWELADNVELECMHFKDKSKFVELPCKVGDTVYEIDEGFEVFPSVVRDIIFDTKGIAFDESAIGKSIFLTKEEAERIAKEREQK